MTTKGNILVTGASGFIGRHFCQAALEKGYTVYALARPSSQTADLQQKGVQVIAADVLDTVVMEKTLREFARKKISIDYILHAAGITKARSANEYARVNVSGTQNLLDACVTTGTKPRKFIFISSLAANGPTGYGHTIPLEQRQPVTAYGNSKLWAEELFVSLKAFPYIILRPTAVYGPGEKDLFTIFRMVRKGIQPVIGFHQQQLTFIYVSDLVELIFAAMASEQENKTYFATDGQVYDKYALGQAIAHALNKKTRRVTLPTALVKTIAYGAYLFSGITKKTPALNPQKHKELVAGSWNCEVETTFKELQYTPVYNLTQGVTETVQWYQQHQWIKN